MFDLVTRVGDELAELTASFDADVVSSVDAARLCVAATRVVRIATALSTVAAGRAASGNAWQDSGAKSAQDWLAGQTGTSRKDAADALRTAERLRSCPDTDAKFRSGDLSADQVSAVASAASADPSAEADLLADAADGATSVERLRDRARSVRAAARPDDGMDAQTRAHAGRYCRVRTDDDGVVKGSFLLPAADGARLIGALDAEHDRFFHEARAAGRKESYDWLHADALTALATPEPDADVSKGGGGATIVVRVDHAALTRGATAPGEECSVDGVGPVPVPVAARLCADAAITALLRGGDDASIVDVRLAGRTVPLRMRIALSHRDRRCVVPGCDAARHLEIHHVEPYAGGGATSLANLCRICSWHHDQITYRGATLARDRSAWVYSPGMDDPGGGPFDDTGIHTDPALFG